MNTAPIPPRPFKIPVSVLVVIHTPALEVLLIERADKPGYWQSVTGSVDDLDEPLADTARREVQEETGITVGELRADYRSLPYVSRPGAPAFTRASFAVEAGSPRLHQTGALSLTER